MYRQLETPEPLGRDLANLGLAVLGLGETARAQRHLAVALQIGSEIHFRSTILHALAPTALLLAALGHMERAVDLYALASCYPVIANSHWFEDVVGQKVAAAAANLPAQVVAAAQEWGRARDLWETAEELSEELPKLGCAR